MKKSGKKLLFIALIACLVLSATLFSACGDKNKDKKEAVSITLSAAPRQYYAPGESIDLTGGEISVSFSDGSTSKFSLSDSAVSVSHFGTNAKNRVEYMTVTYGGKSLKIPYYVNSGTATQIVGVELEKGNMFTTYSVGGTFAYGTSYFKVLYSNGKYSSYPLSSESTRNGYNFSFSGFDSKTVGENKKAVFTFYATTFEIEYDIVDYVFAMNILMDNNIGNVYMLGDQIELNDSMFSVVCSDGTIKGVDLTADMISGFDTSSAGEKELTVSYKWGNTDKDFVFTQNVKYTVVDENNIVSVGVDLAEGEWSYNVGDDTLNIKNSYVVLDFGGGITKKVSMLDESVSVDMSTFDTSLGGVFKLKLIYTTPNGNQYPVEVSYTVQRIVTSMTLMNRDSITTAYSLGQEFSFGDAYMHVVYNDKTVKDFNLAEQYALEPEKRTIGFYKLEKSSSGSTVYTVLEYGDISTTNAGTFEFYIRNVQGDEKIVYDVT